MYITHLLTFIVLPCTDHDLFSRVLQRSWFKLALSGVRSGHFVQLQWLSGLDMRLSDWTHEETSDS